MIFAHPPSMAFAHPPSMIFAHPPSMAVGSSQNVSMVNTVLCTIIAEQFAAFSDAIEGGAKPADVAASALTDHWKVIFNGNGYSEEWPIEAGKRGVWRIDSGVDSMAVLGNAKNTVRASPTISPPP